MTKARVFPLLLFAGLAWMAKAQDTLATKESPVILIRSSADQLLEAGDLQGAIAAYQAEMERGDSNFDAYNYSCALAIDLQIDTAFYYLGLALQHDSSVHALCDPDLMNLRDDPRWREVEEQQIEKVQRRNGRAIRDTAYAKRLWLISAKDQSFYSVLRTAEEKVDRNSTVARALWQLKQRLNAENRQELLTLLAAKGWPRRSDVGPEAAQAAFLVVQHADLALQQEFLPVLEQRVKEGEADPEEYALMYDRIQTDLGKPQKYGSQLRFNQATQAYELYPLQDPAQVDRWRAEAGMIPLADYVSIFGVVLKGK